MGVGLSGTVGLNGISTVTNQQRDSAALALLNQRSDLLRWFAGRDRVRRRLSPFVRAWAR